MRPALHLPPCLDAQSILAEAGGDANVGLTLLIGYFNDTLVPAMREVQNIVDGNIELVNMKNPPPRAADVEHDHDHITLDGVVPDQHHDEDHAHAHDDTTGKGWDDHHSHTGGVWVFATGAETYGGNVTYAHWSGPGSVAGSYTAAAAPGEFLIQVTAQYDTKQHIVGLTGTSAGAS